MRVVIAGGGTAGHVNPALALAHALDGDEVSFVGTERGLEARMVPEHGFRFRAIEVAGFDRAKPYAFPVVAVRAATAIRQSRALLAEIAPDVVVGMGGYVSLPVALAARSRRIPLVLHEQNIVLGLANRVAKRGAQRVAVSFEETLSEAGPRGVHTGNPVAADLAHLDRDAARASAYEHFDLSPDRRTVLIFGGSLGAHTLNVAGYELAIAWKDRTDVQIFHISGRKGLMIMGDPPPDVSGVLHHADYVDDMKLAYAVADLAICRGGATTVAELCAVGLPAVIVPYPHHRDRQQERHGRVLEAAGAAVVVGDAEATAARLASIAGELLVEDRLARMAVAARSLGRPDAAGALARVVREVA
jgi:UDP-N-acetylglucosamine--N-acetylmuramyl-(pentapeptide) pyrophosphoryl-undecaprenol N-acetylglucosamine transferase